MAYERMTERKENGAVQYEDRNGYHHTFYSGNDGDPVHALAWKLAELEDKLEQGTLKELPCKVGDTVCKYYKGENGIKIISGTVSKIEIRNNGILIYITTLPNFRYDKAFIGNLTNGYIDTTCYYFCPVEEAEKRLKELQA